MANKFIISVCDDIDEIPWIDKIEPFLCKVMQKLCYDCEEISVLFCRDEFISKMNNEYRHIESATDVLSFENNAEYIEDGIKWKCVGDILISIDTLKKNAEFFKVSADDELKRLLVHGILHLNGMDHGDEHIETSKIPDCEMLVLQEKILLELADEHLMNDF